MEKPDLKNRQIFLRNVEIKVFPTVNEPGHGQSGGLVPDVARDSYIVPSTSNVSNAV